MIVRLVKRKKGQPLTKCVAFPPLQDTA